MKTQTTTQSVTNTTPARSPSKRNIKNSVQLRQDAKRIMWDYYSTHKSTLPDFIRQFREEIIDQLIEGKPVEEAFNSVLVTSN